MLSISRGPRILGNVLLDFRRIFTVFKTAVLIPLVLKVPISITLFTDKVNALVCRITAGTGIPICLKSSFTCVATVTITVRRVNKSVGTTRANIVVIKLICILVTKVIGVLNAG